ncbi:MAG: carbamate kinase [Desulfobulbaceae bacterium]|nr:carbamate kinase [Desulfobulbaceae bacterium]
MELSPQSKEILLIALGGNALIRKGQTGTTEEQFANLRLPIGQIAELVDEYRIIITYGNGPQVGNLLLQQDSCSEVPKLPLEILVAQTQGQIGYMIESSLDSKLALRGRSKDIVSLLSYVVVDRDDPAFAKPSKPIGPAYSKDKAATMPFPTAVTPKGYRRVVASPRPLTIVEKREIKKLIDRDFIVICCGGGGIPVTREGRTFHGIDAVVDKDLASAKLAEEVGADLFVIATDVQGVYKNFGRDDEELLPSLSTEEAEQYLTEGHFGEGSMGPKIEAGLEFIKHGGQKTIITSIDAIIPAIRGKAGTVIAPPEVTGHMARN